MSPDTGRRRAHVLRGLRIAWQGHRDLCLLVGAALGLVIALIGPGWLAERARFDHVIVLDITQSMDVQDQVLDGQPVSRLVAAKAALRQALTQLPCGSRVGWGVFTEYRAFLLNEPIEVCAHLAELRATLARIDGGMAWSGNSEIAKGLHSALQIARQLEHLPTLVFVTDGQEAPPLSPQHRPSFDDPPGEPKGLILGVGELQLSPIPKRDPSGRPLGFWRADEVAQVDPYQTGRAGSVSGEHMAEEPAAAAPQAAALGATPGSEHLSALREPYLRQLAQTHGLAFERLSTPAALTRALTASELAHPVRVRVDGWRACAIGALGLLLARYWGAWRRAAKRAASFNP